jgi:hypothetical protein
VLAAQKTTINNTDLFMTHVFLCLYDCLSKTVPKFLSN